MLILCNAFLGCTICVVHLRLFVFTLPPKISECGSDIIRAMQAHVSRYGPCSPSRNSQNQTQTQEFDGGYWVVFLWGRVRVPRGSQKNAEFLDKSSINIDILPVFFWTVGKS